MSQILQPLRRSLLTSAIATLSTFPLAIFTQKAQAQSKDRYTRGLETLKRFGGNDYDRTIRPLEAFSPDLAKMLVEHEFGDIMSRPGLDLKQREIANVAALTAIGSVRPTLKYHIHGMLNVGCMPQEVIETILNAIVYAGFPAAQDGITIAREVFKERKLNYQPISSRPEGDRYQLGIQNLQQTEGDYLRLGIHSISTGVVPITSPSTTTCCGGLVVTLNRFDRKNPTSSRPDASPSMVELSKSNFDGRLPAS